MIFSDILSKPWRKINGIFSAFIGYVICQCLTHTGFLEIRKIILFILSIGAVRVYMYLFIRHLNGKNSIYLHTAHTFSEVMLPPVVILSAVTTEFVACTLIKSMLIPSSYAHTWAAFKHNIHMIVTH